MEIITVTFNCCLVSQWNETIERIMIEEGNVICFHQFDKGNKWGDYVSPWKRYLLLNTHTKQLEIETLI